MANMSAFKAQLISIHAPRAGSDPHCSAIALAMPGFQSTLPVRGATHGVFVVFILSAVFQSTLPVRGATIFQCFPRSNTVISIHAPRAGSDWLCRCPFHNNSGISIHAPRAGSDEIVGLIVTVGMISIHAPRAGSDPFYFLVPYRYKFYFNPRSPCGERHWGLLY